ncbi:MAG: CGNR zinc finger domain-containing protein, partial [Planctomycetota bacterium]
MAWGRQARTLTDREAVQLRRASGRRPERAREVFRRALVLRECLFRVFSAEARGNVPAAGDLAGLNTELSTVLPRLQLVRTGEVYAWSWSGAVDALDRMLWPVLRSAAELLTSDRRDRVRECNSDCCTWLFIDRSPAGRRRWCDMSSCGNRHKARRYYARKK